MEIKCASIFARFLLNYSGNDANYCMQRYLSWNSAICKHVSGSNFIAIQTHIQAEKIIA